MSWLRLHVSNVCNLSCSYCHVEKNTLKPFMSIKTMQDSLDLMKDLDKSSPLVSLYGGEPLLNKELFSFIESNKANYILNTNATLLDEDKIIFLKNNSVDIHVSCDGFPAAHDQNRIDKEGKPTFDKVEKALLLIKKHSAKAQLNSFIMPQNINSLKDLIVIAKEFNINRIYLDLLYSKNMLKATDVVPKYLEISKYAKDNNIKILGPWSNLNNKRSLGLEVNTDASFYFNNYPLSRNLNLKLENLRDIFNSKQYQEFNNTTLNYFRQKCQSCILSQTCKGEAIRQFHYHVNKETGYQESCSSMIGIVRGTSNV